MRKPSPRYSSTKAPRINFSARWRFFLLSIKRFPSGVSLFCWFIKSSHRTCVSAENVLVGVVRGMSILMLRPCELKLRLLGLDLTLLRCLSLFFLDLIPSIDRFLGDSTNLATLFSKPIIPSSSSCAVSCLSSRSPSSAGSRMLSVQPEEIKPINSRRIFRC